MSHVRLTKEFTTDERDGDVVSIALAIEGDADELWRTSFVHWISDADWLGDNNGVILGHSFPFSYDGTNAIEFRTHASTIERSLSSISLTIDKVNEERTQAAIHNPKATGVAEQTVQAWFDQQ